MFRFLLLTSIVVLGTMATAADGPPAGARPAAIIDAATYATLQAAFDAVPAEGGLVRLPPGEFRLERPLVLSRSNTRVEGAGAATRLVNVAKGQPALVVRAEEPPAPPAANEKPAGDAQAARAKPKKPARLWRVQLANFRLSGDPAAPDNKGGQSETGDGVLMENVDELYLEGLTVDHHGGNGINLLNCYEDPRIADCLITYNRAVGLNIEGGHDIVVNANHFEENQDAVRCVDSFNLCMNGNNLDDHLGNGVIIENTYGSVLSGNMIEECNGTAIIVDRDCYGITLSANVIAHNTAGGIELRDAWGCTVSANTFTIVAARGLVVGPASGRITVTGNNFSNSHIGGANKREDPAAGIHLDGASDVAISGNVFAGLCEPAIQAKGACQRISVVGNIVVDVDRKGSGTPLDLKAASGGKEEQNLVAPAEK